MASPSGVAAWYWVSVQGGGGCGISAKATRAKAQSPAAVRRNTPPSNRKFKSDDARPGALFPLHRITHFTFSLCRIEVKKWLIMQYLSGSRAI